MSDPTDEPEQPRDADVELSGVVAEGVAHSVVGEATAVSVGTGFLLSRIPIRTTMPEELLRHDISDEELDMLGDTKRGFFHEFTWATVTGALGSVWGAGDALYSAFGASHPVALSGYAVWEIVLCAGFLVLAAFSGAMVFRESAHDPNSLKEKIRARTRSHDG